MIHFEKWLINYVDSPNTAYKYSRAINSISDDMISMKVINNNLYDYTNLLELNFCIDKILNDDSFVEKNTTGHNMYSSALKYFIQYKNEFSNISDIELTEEDSAFPEGKSVLRQHIIRERNQEVIKKAKQKFRDIHEGKLFCEICEFDFQKKYGELGDNFIEAHHIKPISEMKDGERTKLDDIIMVCSNCHSMIHRKRPWLTRDMLRNLLYH